MSRTASHLLIAVVTVVVITAVVAAGISLGPLHSLRAVTGLREIDLILLWLLIAACVVLPTAIFITLWWHVRARGHRLSRMKLPEPHEVEVEGRVKLQGEVRAHREVLAPVSGEQAVAYQLMVEEIAQGPRYELMHKVKEVVEVNAFDIVGSADVAIAVETDRLGMLLAKRRKQLVCSREVLTALFDLLGISGSDRKGTRYRITECRLMNGAAVVLDGVVKDVLTPEGSSAGFRAAPTRRVIGSSEELESDLDGPYAPRAVQEGDAAGLRDRPVRASGDKGAHARGRSAPRQPQTRCGQAASR